SMNNSTLQLNRILQNDGTATWTSGAFQMFGGTVNNNGSFTASSNATLQCYGSPGGVNAFNNNLGATFTKLGTGETQFIVSSTGVTFNNSGTVNVNAGNLNLSQGGSHSGDFNGVAGSLLIFGGNHTFAAGSHIIG